eukprot:11213729-Lingulodinium_polyedra.AAC.1
MPAPRPRCHARTLESGPTCRRLRTSRWTSSLAMLIRPRSAILNRQKVPDLGNSIIQVLFYQMITAINRNTEFKCRASGLLLDKNSSEEHAEFLSGTSDVDFDCRLMG